MPTASFVKYHCFTENLAEKVHNLGADALTIALTDAAPDVAAHSLLSHVTQIAYTNLPTSRVCSITGSAQSGGTYKLTLGDMVLTATGAVGPFRYAVLYNDTPASPLDPLIGYWDYGQSITLGATETFTLNADEANGVLQI